MLRPFKNEVLDTVVERTDNHGFFSKIGPLKIFVHKYSMPEDMTFNDDCWISNDETVEIKDEQGNVTGTEQRPVMQSIQPSSSEVMANLVACIQEQQALITQLQADVAALKGTA